jgi:hypothetical protein
MVMEVPLARAIAAATAHLCRVDRRSSCMLGQQRQRAAGGCDAPRAYVAGVCERARPDRHDHGRRELRVRAGPRRKRVVLRRQRVWPTWHQRSPAAADSDANRRLPPTQKIAAGDGSTCARTGDGNIWCWGRNDEGRYRGFPATDPTLKPTRIVWPSVVHRGLRTGPSPSSCTP